MPIPQAWRIAGLGLLLAAGSRSVMAACEGLDPITPEVTIKVADLPAPRIVGATVAEIRRQATASPDGGVTRGLTVSAAATTARYALVTATLPDGARCVALKSITAQAASRDLTVLIDERYRPGSCEYRAVLDHEQEHVRIDAQALRRTGELATQRLRSVARDWAGRWVPEKASTAIGEAVNGNLEQAVREARQEAGLSNERLDLPESYGRVQARCGHW